jgi:hypothetical protein
MRAILILAMFFSSCKYFESDYDKLMNPIKKIKLAEEKSGVKSRIYNGIHEPDFPDEELNNKTIEGVDTNHDGVRDDVEIWINRTSENEYVALAMKDYYRQKLNMFLKAAERKISPEQFLREEEKVTNSLFCLDMTTSVVNNDPYISKHNYLVDIKLKLFYIALLNSPARSRINSVANNYSATGVIRTIDGYCTNVLGNYYLKIVEKMQSSRK